MTWKTYAAVSGATVLAGWLASSPPPNAPSSSASTQRRPAASEAPTPADSDIEEQAARLQARLRQEAVYRAPERNPFRFGVREQPARPDTSERRETPAPSLETFVPSPQPPPLRLSGIAEDRAGERVERTAVLSSPAGVLLVREGDTVLGQYRVVAIEADAVQLIGITDGGVLRLSLRTPNAQ